MFWTLAALFTLISLALTPVVLWAISRLWKRKAGLGRCTVAALIFISIGCAGIFADIVLQQKSLGTALILLCLAVLFVSIKWASRARWGRAALVFITFLPAHVAAQVSLTYGVGHRVMRAYHVPTGAMSPTIEPGDRILADRVTPPRRWDVIVFRAPHEPQTNYVKRLVGLPGETVEIVEEGIKINGALIPKPAHLNWLHHDGTMTRAGLPGRGCTGSPITLGPDEYYVLGDNTRQSLDSRLWGDPQEPGPQPGAVPRRSISGIVRMIYAPMTRARALER